MKSPISGGVKRKMHVGQVKKSVTAKGKRHIKGTQEAGIGGDGMKREEIRGKGGGFIH